MSMGFEPRVVSQPSTMGCATDGAIKLPESRVAQIREWLLLLLRFAITRDPSDQAVVRSVANEIDSFGPQRRQPTIRCEMPFSRSISRASRIFA
jgi:hypothetical protein